MGSKQMKQEAMLIPCRVLDLTDEKGFLCGRILGDLGADVIKVEKPGGDTSRNIGPFYHGEIDSEKSLYWWAYNCSKRGITLDIETEDGKEIFRRLVQKSDVVVESFSPGYMDELGLGYAQLGEINPEIIVTSITPFGQTGPNKDYKASDLVISAMAGLMFHCGDPDRAPVRISFPQACLHAGSAAAQGTIIALYYRGLSGEGQHVDVSTLESMACTLMHIRPYWELSGLELQRAGQFRIDIMSGTGCVARMVWPCKDGYVMFSIMGGATGAPSNRALVQWMDEEGMAPDFLKRDWEALDMVKATQEDFDLFQQPIGEFFKQHTQAELHENALKRGIMFYPVNTAREILADPQLEARGFWQLVEHPELTTEIKYPGSFVKLSDTSCEIRRRAPLAGEHNTDVYKEVGLSEAEITTLKQTNVI